LIKSVKCSPGWCTNINILQYLVIWLHNQSKTLMTTGWDRAKIPIHCFEAHKSKRCEVKRIPNKYVYLANVFMGVHDLIFDMKGPSGLRRKYCSSQ
jgi:hypothetical protein